MSLVKKIIINTALHTFGKFGASLIGLLIVAILTRYLGVEGYGAYTTIFAYLFFFAILSDLGLYIITVNELTRSEFGEEDFFNNVFSLRFVSALIFMIAAGGLVWFLPYSNLIKLGVAIASVSIFLNLIDTIVVAFFQNKIEMKRVAVAELVGKLMTLLLTVGFVYLDLGLWWVLGAVVVGFGTNVLINLAYLRKFIKLKLSFDFKIWIKIIKTSWPIAVTTVFSLIYFKADTLLLSVLPVNITYARSNEEAVGIYGAAYKILEVLIAWPAIFMGLVSPFLSRAWREKNKLKFNNVFQQAFDGLAVIIWPMIIGGLVVAKPLMNLIAGNEFIESGLVFQILIFAVGVIFMTHLTTYAIIAIDRQKEMIKFYALADCLALAGYIWLIPKYAYLAAAGVTVGVEIFMLLATWYLLKKKVGLKIKFEIFGKALIAAAIMGCLLVSWANWNVILIIIFGVFLYSGILWLIRGVDKNWLNILIKKNHK